jgi:hypothetical protein
MEQRNRAKWYFPCVERSVEGIPEFFVASIEFLHPIYLSTSRHVLILTDRRFDDRHDRSGLTLSIAILPLSGTENSQRSENVSKE